MKEIRAYIRVHIAPVGPFGRPNKYRVRSITKTFDRRLGIELEIAVARGI
jgi:hypothetical protein